MTENDTRPVVDRDALAVALHAAIVDEQPGHVEWTDCPTTGPCGQDADYLIERGVVQDAATVRRAVAEEIAARCYVEVGEHARLAAECSDDRNPLNVTHRLVHSCKGEGYQDAAALAREVGEGR